MAKKHAAMLPPAEIALLCDQLSMILSAGIPMQEGLETVADAYRGTPFFDTFSQMRSSVEQGAPLAQAMAEAKIFPGYLVSMLRIGEYTGKLDEVLSLLSRYYDWESDIFQSLKNAVVYPAVLLVMLAAVIGVLVAWVLPVFSRVFAGLGAQAGATAQRAMSVGMGIGTAVLVIVGVVLVVAAVIGVLLTTKKRARVLAGLCRIFPAFGYVSERLCAGRFCAVMQMVLLSGSTVQNGITLSEGVITDARYQQRVAYCGELLEAGASFAEASAKADLLEDMHQKLVHFGANAGQLDSVMGKLCGIYQEQTDLGIRHLVSLIEPSLVTVLSVVIGGILLSVMLPLVSILSTLG